MIKSLIVIGDFFCLNIAYAVVCYWGGGFDGGFGVKIIWLLLNLSYFPVFSLDKSYTGRVVPLSGFSIIDILFANR